MKTRNRVLFQKHDIEKMTDKKSDELHIIIAVNPMVNIYLSDLIEHIHPGAVMIIEFYPRKLLSEYPDHEIIRYTHSDHWSYLRNIKKCVSDIRKIENQYQIINFYFAHAFNAVTNHFFFSDSRKYKFNLIPDGMANYIRISTREFSLKMFMKKISSILTGVRFTMYTGHLTGIDTGRYTRIFAVSEQGLITGNTPVIKLDLRRYSRIEEHHPPQMLILGQSYRDYRRYRNTYRRIFEYLRTKHEDRYTYHYKAHPNETVSPEFMDLLKKFDIKSIRSDRPVEYLAADYEVIVSEFSSALSNIKIIYGEQIKCIGLIKMPGKGILNTYRRKRVIEVRDHFRNLGVEVIEW